MYKKVQKSYFFTFFIISQTVHSKELKSLNEEIGEQY